APTPEEPPATNHQSLITIHRPHRRLTSTLTIRSILNLRTQSKQGITSAALAEIDLTKIIEPKSAVGGLSFAIIHRVITNRLVCPNLHFSQYGLNPRRMTHVRAREGDLPYDRIQTKDHRTGMQAYSKAKRRG